MRKESLLRKFRIGRKIFRAKLFKEYMPLTVSWSITRKCNQKCIYCGINSIKKIELDTKTIFDIIDELSLIGTESIVFTGGEPLLREDIGDIIDYTKSRKILPMLNTNGKLIKKLINKIANVSKITVSLDGPRDIHNKLRQDESFDEVIEAIELCKSENIRVVISTVLSKYNVEEIDFILNIAKKYGVKIIFQPASLYILGKKEKNPVVLKPERFKKVIKMLIMRKSKGEKSIYNSLAGLKYLYNWPAPNKIPCWASKLHLRIDCNGDVYKCGRILLKNEKNLENCVSMGVAEAFRSIRDSQSCNSCWCASMVEFNLLMAFNHSALMNILFSEWGTI